MTWQVILEHRDDDQSLFRRTLTLRHDGSLVLEGHDLGRGVSDIFGPDLNEYESARTVPPEEIDGLRRALGLSADGDLPGVLEERFAHPGGSRAFEQFLKEHGIASEFWSRVGN